MTHNLVSFTVPFLLFVSNMHKQYSQHHDKTDLFWYTSTFFACKLIIYGIYFQCSILRTIILSVFFMWTLFISAIMENYATQPCRKPSWSHNMHVASGPPDCSSKNKCLETSFWLQHQCWTFLCLSLCQMNRKSPLSVCRCTVWRTAPRTPQRYRLLPACRLKYTKFGSVMVFHLLVSWTTPGFPFVGWLYTPPRPLTHLLPGPNQWRCGSLQGGRSRLWNYIFKK